MSDVSGLGAASSRSWGEFIRYFAVSGVGLAVDFALLTALVEIAGMALLTANTISFMTGMIVVYLGSIYWVFSYRRLAQPGREFAIFCAIGVAVLSVNHIALLTAVDAMGEPYYVAKIFAAAASFLANYVIRKAALFT